MFSPTYHKQADFWSIDLAEDEEFERSLVFYYRKFCFYMFLILSLAIGNLHSHVMSSDICFWVLVLQIIYFELDLTAIRLFMFIRVLQPLAFVTAFASASIGILALSNVKDIIKFRAEKDGIDESSSYTLHVFMWVLPALSHIIDVTVSLKRLRSHINLVILNLSTIKTRVFFQLVWMVSAPPIVYCIWFLSGHHITDVYRSNIDGVKHTVDENIFWPVLSCIYITSVIFNIYILRIISESQLAGLATSPFFRNNNW